MADNRRIDDLKRRVQLDPASIAFAALAEEYRRAGRYEESVATCQAGLQRHPAYVSARVTLGRALMALGQYDEARQELEQVLAVAPENLTAIRALAEIHSHFGELPEPTPPISALAEQSLPPSPTESSEAAVSPAQKVEPLPFRPVRVATLTRTDTSEAAAEVVPTSVAASDDTVRSSLPAHPREDPTLRSLETFLAAIIRARQAIDGGDMSKRRPQ